VKLTKKTLKQLIEEVLEESAWSGSGPVAEPIEEEGGSDPMGTLKRAARRFVEPMLRSSSPKYARQQRRGDLARKQARQDKTFLKRYRTSLLDMYISNGIIEQDPFEGSYVYNNATFPSIEAAARAYESETSVDEIRAMFEKGNVGALGPKYENLYLGDKTLKLTKNALKQLIKEELENIQEDELELNPLAGKSDWIQQMENDIRSNTDDIQNILRVMKKYGMVR
jgi:hypothetical protein